MRFAAAAALSSWLVTPVLAAPPAVRNARVEERSAASGLAPIVTAEVSSRQGPLWVGWSVPASVPRSSCCCWSSAAKVGGRGCRLEGDAGYVQTNDEGQRLEGSDRVMILVRAQGGRVGRIRAISEDCPVDAGGLALVWLEDVRPGESVALVGSFVGRPAEGGGGGERLDEAATMAIALHADPSADAALEGFLAASRPLELRKQAAFWMGQARGERGAQVLKRLVKDDADPRLREHAVFALSLNHEPGAVDAIIGVARRDPDAHVRGQALFWLAQTASRRAAGAIRAATFDDPEIGVKRKAVFALSQLPKEEGLPLLIDLARNHPRPEVREQAMFWLGQSGDPRALAFFEDVLAR